MVSKSTEAIKKYERMSRVLIPHSFAIHLCTVKNLPVAHLWWTTQEQNQLEYMGHGLKIFGESEVFCFFFLLLFGTKWVWIHTAGCLVRLPWNRSSLRNDSLKCNRLPVESQWCCGKGLSIYWIYSCACLPGKATHLLTLQWVSLR